MVFFISYGKDHELYYINLYSEIDMSDQNRINLGLFVVDKKCKFIKIADLAIMGVVKNAVQI